MNQKSLKNIQWGIIGLGKIAHKFASDLAEVPNTFLYAVASRSQENANAFAHEFNASKSYGSYEDMVNDPEVDAIYIATPHCFHKEHALLCLQHQKAVLCEKPFAMNLHQVSEMVTLAKAQKVLLMEALWTYFLPHYTFVLEIVNEERFGKLIGLEADFGFYAPFNPDSRVFRKELGGGSLLDIGIYPIFAALSTLGVPEHIEASATFFENGADASCDMIFQYPNAHAILKSTFLEETPTEAIFTFENASIQIHSRFHESSRVRIFHDGNEEIHDFERKTLGYSYEIEHFNQLLRAGKTESNLMTFEFSKNLIKTLDAVREKIDLAY
ncbi:Gfo/Idh/MocA family oxidoreductase [Polaribacter sp. HL-MS24]|uniref:Gfo/Idh/MocA family protein n=1 Tax=Polaribacter sp. HL-MS24 TaxID=3077735 RepID=UPI00293466BD|nr:Gfo/Idh/MocA family oxidoreductase [Polaribacter sp. HL-MS24]WOC40287.1 Gfo/Idh/MocA family oxidoreductase [Polaribacter sp. HL-MS24]